MVLRAIAPARVAGMARSIDRRPPRRSGAGDPERVRRGPPCQRAVEPAQRTDGIAGSEHALRAGLQRQFRLTHLPVSAFHRIGRFGPTSHSQHFAAQTDTLLARDGIDYRRASDPADGTGTMTATSASRTIIFSMALVAVSGVALAFAILHARREPPADASAAAMAPAISRPAPGAREQSPAPLATAKAEANAIADALSGSPPPPENSDGVPTFDVARIERPGAPRRGVAALSQRQLYHVGNGRR